MNVDLLKNLLRNVKNGDVSIEAALDELQHLPFEAIEHANIDHHRSLRCGMPEAIYCPGKTTEQIVEIFARLAAKGSNVLATRTDEATYRAVVTRCPNARFEKLARTITLQQEPERDAPGLIAVVSAGTSDIPVAEEARVTAEMFHQKVETHYDVGVAGLHRLLSRSADLQKATVIIVVAGMEGALASVVGGLVATPIIGVPTSVGYGANFSGIAPLLTMLNSCAPGVAVVNIDAGFSAACLAALICQKIDQKP